MSDERKEQAGMAAIERRRGMTPEQAAALTAHFNSQNDLYTTCQRCKTRITGTLAQLQAHRCGG